jgi:Uma2 family endonuclease
MAMPAVNRRWTAREVRALIAESPKVSPRYELVDGELLVTPSPRPLHQVVATTLAAMLFPYVEAHSLGFAVTSPSDVELEPEFLSQPDVFVIPMREWRRIRSTDEQVIRELLLAVEVLSPGSGRHDRVRKRSMYQRHVSEYWIVDADARIFERWLPSDNRPEILTETLEWSPEGASEPFRLDVAQFFARLLDESA